MFAPSFFVDNGGGLCYKGLVRTKEGANEMAKIIDTTKITKAVRERALRAAKNAAVDAVKFGWWKRGGADIAIPAKGHSFYYFFGFKSQPYTSKFDGEYVPLGALACAAAKAVARETGLKPNNYTVIQTAIWAAAKVGNVDLSEFRLNDLIFFNTVGEVK